MVIRRFAALLILCAVLYWPNAAGAQPEDASAQAAAAYEAGRFGEAIQIYESIVAQGISSVALYYNLGNAYSQVGELGRALLNYRRAQRLAPRDSDVDAAVARTLSQAGLVPGDDPRLMAQIAMLTAEALTVPELAWVTLLCWLVFCGAAGFVVLHRTKRPDGERAPGMYIGQRRVLMITGAALAVAVVLLAARAAFETWQPGFVIVVERAAVMSGPGEAYLHLDDLFEATEGYLLEERGEWVRFGLADGRQGWIVGDAIEMLDR